MESSRPTSKERKGNNDEVPLDKTVGTPINKGSFKTLKAKTKNDDKTAKEEEGKDGQKNSTKPESKTSGEKLAKTEGDEKAAEKPPGQKSEITKKEDTKKTDSKPHDDKETSKAEPKDDLKSEPKSSAEKSHNKTTDEKTEKTSPAPTDSTRKTSSKPSDDKETPKAEPKEAKKPEPKPSAEKPVNKATSEKVAKTPPARTDQSTKKADSKPTGDKETSKAELKDATKPEPKSSKEKLAKKTAAEKTAETSQVNQLKNKEETQKEEPKIPDISVDATLPSPDTISERMVLLEQSMRNRPPRQPRTPVEKLPIITVMWNGILHHFPLYAVQRTKFSSPEFSINLQVYCDTYNSLVAKHWMEKIPVFKDIILITAAPKQAWELDKTNVTMDTKIGEGHFGEVWKGQLKTRIGESIVVAVKVMKVNSNTQHQLEMFHQEARLMRMYDHRNVVKLHGLVFSEDDVMVVMELVSGGSLNHYLKQHKLMPLTKASFCYDIAAGLAYLHARNCMHRDVAARNCLVATDGRLVKLSDFGLAAHGSRIKLSTTEKVPIRWQAPEVLFYYTYMRESDVWSYGMLMSEIYNDGKVPFHDKTIAEVRARIHDPNFRPFVPQLPNYPKIPMLMHRCWELDVMKRPTMKEAAKQLKGYCIHTVKEKPAVTTDSKQQLIERVKTRGRIELPSTMVDETEMDEAVKDCRLKPFVPTNTGSKRQHASPDNDNHKNEQPRKQGELPKSHASKSRRQHDKKKDTSQKK
ncbi:unnamed protein product [Haemonchus placei]|uniref:Protein kinase domain-containing protein n=1 Tax=Haemonchus placei TaxID=6290 RepID=A0A0N4X501_HAEPC|nr:unnamed protein product [Haemonchus placei]